MITPDPRERTTPDPNDRVHVVLEPDRRVRETEGACPSCGRLVPAGVVLSGGQAFLEKGCTDCGTHRVLLSRHGEEWAELDAAYFKADPRRGPQRDFILRMTERCNLACPICLANANTQKTPDLPLERLAELLATHRNHKIKIDFMAAEPTLRSDLLDWVMAVKAAGHSAALHTNGLRLADPAQVRALAAAGVDEVFLQFDGLDDGANIALRGRPLLDLRLKVLRNLREAGLATSLIVVIAKGLNEDQVGETLRFALRPENDHIREVFYLGLRGMGAARHTEPPQAQSTTPGHDWMSQTLMPDALLDLLCAQYPTVLRADVRAFNRLYFAMLGAFAVRKCLYVQHYLLCREADGTARPITDFLDIEALARLVETFASEVKTTPVAAHLRLFWKAALRSGALRPAALRLLPDFLKLERLFEKGMRLDGVPRRFLVLGFITACDLENHDIAVARGCGKGELSVDGGLHDSGAEANVARERRFLQPIAK
jgi:uncharacterized radical SAM superfamily Fe-S cluster-containing enzyme